MRNPEKSIRTKYVEYSGVRSLKMRLVCFQQSSTLETSVLSGAICGASSDGDNDLNNSDTTYHSL